MSTSRVALITGVTGQDGAYLAELLLSKGYIVHGLKRRSSSFNSQRVDHFYKDPHIEDARFFMHYGDMTDATNLIRVVQETKPDEIYNLAAQSHVKVSFETAEYTGNADALGTVRLLEAMRILGLGRSTRFYQASTSELYGKVMETPQSETTPFYPALALRGREALRLLDRGELPRGLRHARLERHPVQHEGPTRGETFVTRKISRAVAAIKLGLQGQLYIGNLDAKRDWGHARDYVEGMWRMLQQDEADDYVLATGETHSVREFIELAFRETGVTVAWRGEGVDEQGYDAATGRTLVAVDPRYFRPTEVELLLGDPSKAARKLGWRHSTPFPELVREMVQSDLRAVAQEAKYRSHREAAE